MVAVFTGEDLADEWFQNPTANPAAVTGYDLSFDQRVQLGGASVTPMAEHPKSSPLSRGTRPSSPGTLRRT